MNDVLPAVVERVEEAVGVLLLLAEIDDVELVPVGVQGAEQTHAPVGVAEDEAAKIAGERLRADPQRHEIIVRPEVGQLGFDEPFVQGGERPAPAQPLRPRSD